MRCAVPGCRKTTEEHEREAMDRATIILCAIAVLAFGALLAGWWLS